MIKLFIVASIAILSLAGCSGLEQQKDTSYEERYRPQVHFEWYTLRPIARMSV